MEQPVGQFNSSQKNNSPLFSVVASIVVAALVAGGGTFWWMNQKAGVKVEGNNQSVVTGVKDVHHWNSKPVEIKDINFAKGLFGLPDGYVKTWDIGTYSDGYGIQSQLNGARIVLVAIRDIGMGEQGPFGTEPTAACDASARIFIFKAPYGNSFVVYDQQYSPNDIVAGGYSFISKDRAPINPNAQFYYELGGGAFIPSLNFPGFIVHGNQTFVLQKSSFLCYAVDAQGKTHIFFDDIKSSLQPTFTDPVLGTAYTDKSQSGIVFRASDGTYIRYNSL